MTIENDERSRKAIERAAAKGLAAFGQAPPAPRMRAEFLEQAQLAASLFETLAEALAAGDDLAEDHWRVFQHAQALLNQALAGLASTK